MNNARADIIALLNRQRTPAAPAFSGLIHVTAEGLQSEGLVLHEVHHEVENLAKAAASTFKLSGMPSAALPLDLCAPAEVLGAELNYYEQGDYRFPQPAKPLFASTKYLTTAYTESADFTKKGRIPIICDAIRLLRQDIGDKIVIAGIIPGPYTLLLYLVEPGGLFGDMKREPDSVHAALWNLSSFLAQIGQAYRDAGADFLTIHDMGGSPGFIGPAKYEQFVFPAEKQLMEELPKPCVLSVCGATNKSMHLLAQTGADAISVDQLTHLASARAILNDTLLFGNIDPVATLWQGDEAQITEAVRGAKEAGVDAIWPGCDLVPMTPIQNIKAIF